MNIARNFIVIGSIYLTWVSHWACTWVGQAITRWRRYTPTSTFWVSR